MHLSHLQCRVGLVTVHKAHPFLKIRAIGGDVHTSCVRTRQNIALVTVGHAYSHKSPEKKQQSLWGPIACETLHRKHRIVDSFELKEIFKGHLAQLSCKEQGHLQLYQVFQSPIQADLKCLQGWSIHQNLDYFSAKATAQL